ncbi:hypothetical protein GVAV_000532, partial [Gurleya vavrai]
SAGPFFYNPLSGPSFFPMFVTPQLYFDPMMYQKGIMKDNFDAMRDSVLDNDDEDAKIDDEDPKNDDEDTKGDDAKGRITSMTSKTPNSQVQIQECSSSTSSFSYKTDDLKGNNFAISKSKVDDKERVKITMIRKSPRSGNSALIVNTSNDTKTILKKKDGNYKKLVTNGKNEKDSNLSQEEGKEIDKIVRDLENEVKSDSEKNNADFDIFNSSLTDMMKKLNADKQKISGKKMKINEILGRFYKFME